MTDDDSRDSPSARRRFLTQAARVGMVGGLAAGYGAFGAVAGRYLYPSGGRPTRWLFVRQVDLIDPGASIEYVGPSGEPIAIARQGTSGDVTDFIALSSTCPHLGCQVHWEANNDRFFCPCHNGVFDPKGKGIGGPPGKAGQSLARYPLKIEGGLLYIEVPEPALVDTGADADEVCGDGHDPCLAPRPRRG